MDNAPALPRPGYNERSSSVQKQNRRKAAGSVLRMAAGYLALIVLGAIFMIPFFWSVSSSLKNDTEIFVFPPTWIPAQPLWNNYGEALEYMRFGLLLRNTLIIATLTTVGNVLTSAFVAYGFSHFRFR